MSVFEDHFPQEDNKHCGCGMFVTSLEQYQDHVIEMQEIEDNDSYLESELKEP